MSQDLSWQEWCDRLRTACPNATIPPYRQIHLLIDLWAAGVSPEEVAARFAATNPQEHYKACACGRSFDREGWGKLDYVGVQVDDASACEMRNCSCGSTLAVEIAKKGETQ